MKARTGFVSNSSSASFIVRKEPLNDSQKYIVENFVEVVKKAEYGDCAPDWQMAEEGPHYSFSTTMDNYSLDEFFENLGINCEEYESY